MAYKRTNKNFIFSFSNYFLILLFCCVTLLPFVLMLIISITDESSIVRNGYSFLPEKLSLQAYGIILGKGSSVLHAYLITIFVTSVGTLLSVTVTSMLAYALHGNNIKYKNKITMFVFLTMLFNGGMVPWYILCTRYLHLNDNILGLIIPMMVNPWNMFLLRNYFNGIPDSLSESAKMDGARAFEILFKIIIPISAPGLATITLFYALAYWNDWWHALMLMSKKNLLPLQYLLYKIQSDVVFAASEGSRYASQVTMPKESIKMATVAVTIGPIIFLYPFIQRYFVKGLVVGAVKA